jgi:hypothetical protein
MQIEDTAFVLFSRPQGETSLWLSVLTQNRGRLNLRYKGGAKKAAACAPFQQLTLTWKSSKSGDWLSACDLNQFYPRLTGMANWCGLYANELLHRGLDVGVVAGELFVAYQQLLQQLSVPQATAQQLGLALRRFEWRFLAALGYGLMLLTPDGSALVRDRCYVWRDDAWHHQSTGILGAELIALTETDTDRIVGSGVRQLLQWRLLQIMPSQAMTMRQWWEQMV